MSMPTGSLTLRDHRADIVRLTCAKCARAGQYRKATLIEPYDGHIALPKLRHGIAQCERRTKMGDACGVHYEGLTCA